MEEKKNILTYEGLKKLEDELHDLKVVKRSEVAQKIKEAREQGDLSENAEYDSAKNEQAELEERIHELEEILRIAKIVQDEDVKGDAVNIGLKVTVKNIDTGEKEVFSIVGATEADPFNGKISTESSVGKALVGKKKNETVEIEVPCGIVNYKIMKIEK